tara:strand:+ start:2193 stop:2756 length:564 start_codon:yes stop_codon:yes gene_type:complete
MPKKKDRTKREKINRPKRNKKPRNLSKKKEKQKRKREKLQQIKYNPNSEPEKEHKDLRKYYLALALMNISQMLAEQGDLTWGGIVDPETYQVVEDYWPGTDVPISEMDKSRINAASSVVVTGDPTIDFERLKSFAPIKMKQSLPFLMPEQTPLFDQLMMTGISPIDEKFLEISSSLMGGKYNKKRVR